MTIINVTLPFNLINKIDDYAKIVSSILKQQFSFDILKFSTNSKGVNLLLNIPEGKKEEILESLKESNVAISKKGRILIDEHLCIECGACVSLCPTDALQLDSEDKLIYLKENCIGCLLCLDSCPRQAIVESD